MNRALVVVDYQNDFVSGSLGFEDAKRIETRIVELIDEFKKNMDFIFYTKDTHQANYLDTVEGKKLPIEHCIKGTWGHELTPNVNNRVGYDPVIEKETFPSLQLGNMLKGLPLTEIHLVGLVSDICVISNAIIAKAACPNAEIYIHKDATDSANKEMQDIAFKLANNLHINVI